CQIMDWSDEVAYSVHDLEDGMWGEVITRERLLSDRTLEAMHAAAPGAPPEEVRAVVDELERVLEVSGERQRKAARKTWSSLAIYELVHAASAAPCPDEGRGPRYAWRLEIEPRLVMKARILKSLAEELVFADRRVAAVPPRASRIVGWLFRRLLDHPELIPEEYRGPDLARSVCDCISGMTDDSAERTYRKLRHLA
ncbi:MAG TPA: hypothetical protein VK009_27550, partial [Chloroflexota bacterium]|nr:hypothetical protein [Chloroflexota bacterium]